MIDRGRFRGDATDKEEGSRAGSLYPPQTRPRPETVSKAMVAEMRQDNLIQFERLEEAADR